MLEAKHISKTFGDRQVQEKQLSYVALIIWRKQMEVN